MKTNIGILGLLLGLIVSCHVNSSTYMDNSSISEDNDADWKLRTAAQQGNAAEVERLLDAGANVDMRDYTKGYTPLHWAVENDHQHTAEALLKKHASVDAAGKIGDTPLHRAAGLGRLAIAQLLVDGYKANVNQQDDDHVTALELAVAIDNLPLVEYLCEQGANVNNIYKDQNTLLHYVKSKEVLERILNSDFRTKELLNKQNFTGCTPLYCAAYRGSKEVVIRLLDLGANPKVVNKEGNSALDEACSKGNLAIAEAIQAKLQVNGCKRKPYNTSMGMTTRSMKRNRAAW